MTEQDLIARRVRDVISEVALDTPEQYILPQTQLRSNLGLDEMDLFDIMHSLHAEFDIFIDDAGHDSITAPNATAGDVLDVVMRHLTKFQPKP